MSVEVTGGWSLGSVDLVGKSGTGMNVCWQTNGD